MLCLRIIEPISHVYIEKNSGPTTDPCGMPKSSGYLSDELSPRHTRNELNVSGIENSDKLCIARDDKKSLFFFLPRCFNLF